MSIPEAVPKVDTGWNLDCIFSNVCRGDLYDMMLDRILTPRGVPGVEFDNHVVRAQWSPHPIDTAFPYYKPKCLLAALTSSFQLRIYDTKDRQQISEVTTAPTEDEDVDSRKRKSAEDDDEDEGGGGGGPESLNSYHDEWTPILDISAEYNKIRASQWAKNPCNFVFATYKERLYELSIVDFSWLEPWDTPDPRSSRLLTFQANGDAVFWDIIIRDDCTSTATVAFKANVHQNGIVCRHRYYPISANSALLAVAFVNGVVKIFGVERQCAPAADEPAGYALKFGESIWEEDEITTDFIEIADEKDDRVGVRLLSLIIVKHPNVIISFRIRLTPDRLGWEEVSSMESPDGHVVAVCRDSDRFIVKHESGSMGILRLEEEEKDRILTYESDVGDVIEPEVDEESAEQHGDYADSHKIHSQDPVYSSLWSYYGFALSPNGVLGCSLKALRRAHDSIVVKEAVACTFVSIFPEEDVWAGVKRVYEESGEKIHRVLDCLHAFRYQLRLERDYNFGRYFPNRSLNSMSVGDLKLYLWILRAMGLPKSWNLPKNMSVDEAEQTSIELLKATTLAQERLVEKYLSGVVEANRDVIPKYEGMKNDAQAWNAMLKYLYSKPEPGIPPGLTQVAGVEKSVCSSCDKEIDYEFNGAFDVARGWSHPGIPGYKWNGQTCEDQHRNPLCVLSLLPIGYPHRMCPNCGCAALIRPVFDQDPLCPFCEEYMSYDPDKTCS